VERATNAYIDPFGNFFKASFISCFDFSMNEDPPLAIKA